MMCEIITCIHSITRRVILPQTSKSQCTSLELCKINVIPEIATKPLCSFVLVRPR